MLPVAILAGGLATRLRPMTETIPKSLVEVAGRPFIFHQLEWLQRQKIRRIVLCVQHLGEMIRDKVGLGDAWGMELRYSFDGSHLLGTGGALRKALPLLGEEFFVFYGDSYLTIELSPVEEAFRASRKPALMCFMKNQGRWDRSNVSASNGQLGAYNKRNPSPSMEYIDYGLSVLTARTFQGSWNLEAFDLADLFHDLAERGELAGKEVFDRFHEIGSKEGLAETEKLLRSLL